MSGHGDGRGGKLLVVNADDLGLSAGVNRGIFEAHERGIVTSASLMVRWAGAKEAAAYARENPRLGVGLHLDLAEWECRDYEWVRLYQVVNLDDQAAVEREVERQVEAFFELMNRKPTHLDSHQHVHLDVRVRGIVEAMAKKLGLVLRHCDTKVKYVGDFYGQDENGEAFHAGISAESLERIVRGVGEGVTELACHPGYDDGLKTMYRVERRMEVAALCDERVRRAVGESGVRLGTFGEVVGEVRCE
jgi:predicted glycoside hydrolase/deacetylase ChbG (UPF0249 family)